MFGSNWQVGASQDARADWGAFFFLGHCASFRLGSWSGDFHGEKKTRKPEALATGWFSSLVWLHIWW